MGYLSLLIFWIIVCLLLWLFNSKNRNYYKTELILFTILESVFVFFFLLITTLNGYLTGFLPFIIFSLGSFGLIYFRIRRNDNFDAELSLEMSKNAFIKFNTVVLPFIIALTIFRFMPFYFQIPCSLVVVVVIHFISLYLQKASVYIVESVRSFSMGIKNFITLWVIVIVMAIVVMVFNFPTYQVEKVLNLQHHSPIYGFFDGYDTELDSSYDLELVDEYEDSEYSYPALPEPEELPDKSYLGFPISQIYYDTENSVTYETYHENLYQTYIIKIDSNDNEEVFTLRGIRNLMVVDDAFYLVNKDINVIEITDENLQITSILNIPLHYALVNNQMKSAEFFYSIRNDEILLTTVEISGYLPEERVYHHKEYIVTQDDIDMNLPFYSHFGLFHIVVLFAIMLIPISDYESSITILDFKSRFTKE